jgi:hypothetical protein
MKSHYLGFFGAAIAVIAAFLLGLSVNSASSPQTAASIPPPPASTAGPDAPATLVPTPPPQVIQLEVTLKQEPGSPQVIEVQAVQVPGPPPPTGQSGVAEARPSMRASATPVPQPTAGVDPRGPRPASPMPIVVTTPIVVSTPIIISQSVPTAAPPPTATPNPCANRICATVLVNFFSSGSGHANVQASCNVAPGSSAWECVRQALGIENIQSKDFGGSLGVFISGLYGVAPDFGACSCFWEFVVNGASSNLGVSGYIVRSGDILEFRIGH